MERFTQDQFINALIARANYLAESSASFSECEDLLLYTLRHIKQTFGTNHSYYAKTLVHLAENCIRTTKYLEAANYYDEAIKIFEKNFGTNHAIVAISYRNLSEILKLQGRLKEASEYSNRAKLIFNITNNNFGN